MKDLIKITTNDKGQQLVSARELHEFLEVKKDFTDWFKYRVAQYGFEENLDFTTILGKSTGGRPSKDFAIKIEMAKELSMVENSEKGKEARKYFIECEKIAKGETNVNKYISEVDNAKAEMGLVREIADILNLNDSSKLQLLGNVLNNHNLPSNLLPTYTDSKGILKSATELLRKYNIQISTRKFNKIMIDKGLLREVERKSTKDNTKIKKFKNLVNTEFGENQVNPNNPKETQPMYYEEKFEELLKRLGIK